MVVNGGKRKPKALYYQDGGCHVPGLNDSPDPVGSEDLKAKSKPFRQYIKSSLVISNIFIDIFETTREEEEQLLWWWFFSILVRGLFLSFCCFASPVRADHGLFSGREVHNQ